MTTTASSDPAVQVPADESPLDNVSVDELRGRYPTLLGAPAPSTRI